MSAFEHELISFEVRRQGACEHFEVRPHAPQLAGRRLVHKYRETNVLIADLEQLASGECTASLRVHNDNEILLDHQTGKHVQGMVAVEAARQMFLACTEQYFLPNEPDLERYFVINKMNTEFLAFLFPLAASLHYRVTEQDATRPDALRFTAVIDIVQAGQIATSTAVDFTAFAAPRIESIETKKAAATTAHVCSLPKQVAQLAGSAAQ